MTGFKTLHWLCVTWVRRTCWLWCALISVVTALAIVSVSSGQDCVDGCWEGMNWYNVNWSPDYQTSETVCVTFAREGGSIPGTCGGKKSLTRWQLSEAARYCAQPNKWRGENIPNYGTIIATQTNYLDEFKCSGGH